MSRALPSLLTQLTFYHHHNLYLCILHFLCPFLLSAKRQRRIFLQNLPHCHANLDFPPCHLDFRLSVSRTVKKHFFLLVSATQFVLFFFCYGSPRKLIKCISKFLFLGYPPWTFTTCPLTSSHRNDCHPLTSPTKTNC